MYCKQITWAILDGSRQYFNTTLTREDFREYEKSGDMDDIEFPTSILTALCLDLHQLKCLDRKDFPERWKEYKKEKPSEQNRRNGREYGWSQRGRYQERPQTPCPWTGHVGENDRPAPREWGRDNAGGKFDHTIKWTENTHPQIKTMMEPYRKNSDEYRWETSSRQITCRCTTWQNPRNG